MKEHPERSHAAFAGYLFLIVLFRKCLIIMPQPLVSMGVSQPLPIVSAFCALLCETGRHVFCSPGWLLEHQEVGQACWRDGHACPGHHRPRHQAHHLPTVES